MRLRFGEDAVRVLGEETPYRGFFSLRRLTLSTGFSPAAGVKP